MAIRLPLQTVLSVTAHGEDGTNSVSGGIATAFLLPQDTDNVVVNLRASTVGGGVSTILQTTDDGGTTWYDVARTSIVSNSSISALAQWMSVPVGGFGFRTTVIRPSVVATGSVQTFGSVLTTTGSSGASTLAQNAFSGLPIMSQNARVFLILTGDVSTGSILTRVYVNSQSATA